MGHAVQVVTVVKVEGGAPYFILEEEALRNVLYQDSVKDLPIVVVSVAGKMRQGKSFLLNYLILYLTSKGVGAWMGEEGNLAGFQWWHGTEACTSGILVWSEVFVVEGPGGKRVAVLLMDTQGTFDTNTTMGECSTVFALSTMLSSVQIYNVMRDINRDDLDSLQLFVQHGEKAWSYMTKPTIPNTNSKHFKNLLFLVRDWECQDCHSLGATGGAEFVKDKLKNVEGIRSYFEEISCFLLPYPWDLKDGQRLGLSVSFRAQLSDFFENLLAWDKLESRVKDFEGETIKTKDILTYFKKFVDIFQDDKMTPPQSAFDANVQIALMKAYEVGMQSFEATRKAITGDKIDDTPSEEPDPFKQFLLQCQRFAVQEFQGGATLGSNKNITDSYLARLQQDTDTIICALVEVNLAKRRNEEEAVKLREEWEEAEMVAETKRDEAERARIDAEEKLDKLQKEKDEAEEKQILAVNRREALGDIDNIKMQLEMMMEKAKQVLAEADEERREAEKEAEIKRKEFEQKSAQRGNVAEMIRTFGGILRDVITVAAPLVPVVMGIVTGEPQAGRGGAGLPRPRATPGVE